MQLWGRRAGHRAKAKLGLGTRQEYLFLKGGKPIFCEMDTVGPYGFLKGSREGMDGSRLGLAVGEEHLQPRLGLVAARCQR